MNQCNRFYIYNIHIISFVIRGVRAENCWAGLDVFRSCNDEGIQYHPHLLICCTIVYILYVYGVQEM